MAEDQNTEQMLENYVRTMGNDLGAVFHHLMQDAARLHLKWNEYLKLFGTGPEVVETLNRAAPGFFYMAQESAWHELLLHISRMTDQRKDVLTLHRLPNLLDAQQRPAIEDKLRALTKATRFARDIRNLHLAHTNLDIALGKAEIVPMSSRAQVRTAIQEIDDLLLAVQKLYTPDAFPTFYEHLDVVGGADSLLDIVKRGLKDRDRQFEFIPNRPY